MSRLGMPLQEVQGDAAQGEAQHRFQCKQHHPHRRAQRAQECHVASAQAGRRHLQGRLQTMSQGLMLVWCAVLCEHSNACQ